MGHPSKPIRIGMIDTKVLSPQKHLEQKNLRGQHGCKNAKGALRLRIVPLLLPFHVLMLSGLFSGFGCVFFQGHWLVLVSCCFLCSLFVVVENPQLEKTYSSRFTSIESVVHESVTTFGSHRVHLVGKNVGIMGSQLQFIAIPTGITVIQFIVCCSNFSMLYCAI